MHWVGVELFALHKAHGLYRFACFYIYRMYECGDEGGIVGGGMDECCGEENKRKPHDILGVVLASTIAFLLQTMNVQDVR